MHSLYCVYQDKIHWVTSSFAFAGYGFSWEDILWVNHNDLSLDLTIFKSMIWTAQLRFKLNPSFSSQDLGNIGRHTYVKGKIST